ncbi:MULTISPECIES: cobalt-precorrin-6A reductase [Streptomyces]|uniref:Cobalt-precorrin-6A reductase n=1 Tax=Streptomyces caniscabiei TaxID=2746961 RepID=A0ABU4N5A5_9ACTN|nr:MULTISPECIES: cobalt-precorrin-6A reductase [Streptomyces]MBE4733979.1 cobalt-precorrin-6A reductase [Streptomyces caniscabiei]MBE4761394.1 cobalt-precorrin-6A reductase [Streptomyces caniscabiei]MBE4775121.1 cobalt-precorrin-6A reductase [Streptomyces caniscabiei]MBE4782474.1 cobalt-precorrin-6A reductase [Streptomyces caniscabiei]MBE4791777.1 cobalt-precorrin-6A reductase [Streptomyces caniscabiei]
MHVLILGGTTEARRLAELLHAIPGVRLTSSLAGRVASPRLPPGEVRVGGFGGAEGLAAWLREHGVDAFIDATHPFAGTMSFHAARAAATTHVPLLALRRPGWAPGPGDDWHDAGSLTEAARLLPTLGRRVFLTTGRMGLAAFAALDDLWFLVRSVDPPEAPYPARTEVLLDRGPFTLDGERELLRRHRVDVVVTKDSGGAATAPKLTAAREAGLPVVVVRRPPVPEDVPVVADPEAAARWVAERLHAR